MLWGCFGFYQRYPHVGRHVANGRNFVAGGAVGHQSPLLIPYPLFAGQPANSLYNPPLYLTDINCRIQRRADVVQNITAKQSVLACQGVNNLFYTGGTKGVVVERGTPASLSIVMYARYFVIAGSGQRYLIADDSA